MNKKIYFLIIILYFVCCNYQGTGIRTTPDWLEVSVDFDSLPGYLISSELTYTINITGKDASYLISNQGDTLDHLWLKFSASDWCDGMNSDADSIWNDKVEIGNEITLKPVFQLLKNGDKLWSYITLNWGYYCLNDISQYSIDTLSNWAMGKFVLSFNHHTGEYNIE